MHQATITALAISLLMLVACGQTGPLRPPDQEATANQDERVRKADVAVPAEQPVPIPDIQDQ